MDKTKAIVAYCESAHMNKKQRTRTIPVHFVVNNTAVENVFCIHLSFLLIL